MGSQNKSMGDIAQLILDATKQLQQQESDRSQGGSSTTSTQESIGSVLEQSDRTSEINPIIRDYLSNTEATPESAERFARESQRICAEQDPHKRIADMRSLIYTYQSILQEGVTIDPEKLSILSGLIYLSSSEAVQYFGQEGRAAVQVYQAIQPPYQESPIVQEPALLAYPYEFKGHEVINHSSRYSYTEGYADKDPDVYGYIHIFYDPSLSAEKLRYVINAMGHEISLEEVKKLQNEIHSKTSDIDEQQELWEAWKVSWYAISQDEIEERKQIIKRYTTNPEEQESRYQEWYQKRATWKGEGGKWKSGGSYSWEQAQTPPTGLTYNDWCNLKLSEEEVSIQTTLRNKCNKAIRQKTEEINKQTREDSERRNVERVKEKYVELNHQLSESNFPFLINLLTYLTSTIEDISDTTLRSTLILSSQEILQAITDISRSLVYKLSTEDFGVWNLQGMSQYIGSMADTMSKQARMTHVSDRVWVEQINESVDLLRSLQSVILGKLSDIHRSQKLDQMIQGIEKIHTQVGQLGHQLASIEKISIERLAVARDQRDIAHQTMLDAIHEAGVQEKLGRASLYLQHENIRALEKVAHAISSAPRRIGFLPIIAS